MGRDLHTSLSVAPSTLQSKTMRSNYEDYTTSNNCEDFNLIPNASSDEFDSLDGDFESCQQDHDEKKEKSFSSPPKNIQSYKAIGFKYE